MTTSLDQNMLSYCNTMLYSKYIRGHALIVQAILDGQLYHRPQNPDFVQSWNIHTKQSEKVMPN